MSFCNDVRNVDIILHLLLRENRIYGQNNLYGSKLPSLHGLKNIDDIPYMQKELMSQKALAKCKNIGVSDEILDIEDRYKMKELKEIVGKNYLLDKHIVGNKSKKRTWSKALNKSKDWGFNTFVVGVKKNKTHHLRGQVDILLMIQDKL